MTDSSGAVIWAADYKPFGEATIAVSTITNNLRFPGQYYDAETGLLYNINRTYNAVLGRYIEADPIGLSSGDNLYSYVGIAPLQYIDPSGLAKQLGRWLPCKGKETEYCSEKCKDRGGVKSCWVYEQLVSTVQDGEVGFKWRRPRVGTGMQCNCNEDEPNQCKLKQPNPFTLFFLWLSWQYYMNQQLQPTTPTLPPIMPLVTPPVFVP